MHTSTIRDKIFHDIHFYTPKEPTHHVRTEEYQMQHGAKQGKIFRKKKEPDFKDHLYSSALNPMARGRGRYDKPYKQLYQRKRVVNPISYKKTNPLTLQHQRLQRFQMRQPQPISHIYQKQIEIKYWLPATRQLAKTHKEYHPQLGLTLPCRDKKIFNVKDNLNNSSLMRQVVQNVEDLPRSRSINHQFKRTNTLWY